MQPQGKVQMPNATYPDPTLYANARIDGFYRGRCIIDDAVAPLARGLPGSPGGPRGQYPLQGGPVGGRYIGGEDVYIFAAARCSAQMTAVMVLPVIV